MKPFHWRELPEDYIIGVDEVGRGCLAGRVYAAAAILNPELSTKQFVDSKTLTAKARNELSQIIKINHRVSTGYAEVEEIEKLNILNASLLAMERAVRGLGLTDEELKLSHLLVDGNQAIKGLYKYKQTLLVKGDSRAEPIAAASIVAKVTRDQELDELSKTYPQYGFENHKGYATKAHLEAIKNFGPSQIHRKTFAGVKEHLMRPTLESRI